MLHDSPLHAPLERAPRHCYISDEHKWVRWQCTKVGRTRNWPPKYRTCLSTRSTCWSCATRGTISTCSRQRSMSDANDAQYDWPCNALSCFKLATGGLDAKTQTKMLCQNDQGMSCGRADSFTHTFKAYPMCTGAFGLCSKVYIRLGTRGQQRRLDPHELFWNLSNESHRNTCRCTERVTVDGPLR